MKRSIQLSLAGLLTATFALSCVYAQTGSGGAPAASQPPADTAPAPAGDAPAAPAADAPPAPVGPTPVERVSGSELGSLKNPYKETDAAIVAQGRKRFMGAGCNGCHGGTGGGGMCPPLSNDVWVYGSEDDTLFRLVTLGSLELQKRYGLTRKGHENVVGPMPPFGEIVKTEDDLWKIITFIRSVYRGDPTRKNW